MVAPPDEGDTATTPSAQAHNEKRCMQPLGKKSPSRGDIVASSFDSVLIVRAHLEQQQNANDELLEKHQGIIKNTKTQQQKQRMVSSPPPMMLRNDKKHGDEDPASDDSIDISLTDSDDTVASIDVVSSSGSTGGDGEISFAGSFDSSSQGSYTEEEEEEEDDDEVVVAAATSSEDHSHPTKEVQRQADAAAAADDVAAAATSEKSSDAAAALSDAASFAALRWSYLIVTLVVMLADGMQGTHLYVLYESYGFSVASLYCLGFFTGAIMSPITGPLVDKMGRRRAAMLYCALEIFINLLEQYPYLVGLVASRMIGGFTTNLLHSVFETWLDTEYRRRKFAKDKYEVIMRDSIIVSNLAAIVSGYLSHILAERYGVVGPFRGAVGCTAVALVVVATVWTENYGDDSAISTTNNKQVGDDDNDTDDESSHKEDSSSNEKRKGMLEFLVEAGDAFLADPRMLRVGIIQGLSSGALHIFIFLWAPMLIALSHNAPKGSWGLDSNGKPAFGLIFGAFMGAGVFGGLAAPPIRKLVSVLLSPRSGAATAENAIVETEIVGEGKVPVRPMAVEFLAACCYFVGAIMLLVPCMVSGEEAFSQVLTVFLIYEFTVGIFFPCEGVIRSLYFPETARASIMAFPAIIVNVAVSFGVISTTFISLTTAFAAISFVMLLSAVLQLSLITMREWSSLFARAEQSSRYARSVSFSAYDSIRSSSTKAMRRLSDSVIAPTNSNSALSSGVGEELITLDALDQHLNHMSSLLKMKDE